MRWHEGWLGRLFDFLLVQFSLSVVSDCLQPHGLQHSRPPCPSPAPRAHSNSHPLSWWCHPTISSSVVPFFCVQSFSVSGSFPMSQFFASVGQSIRVSASASLLPVNIQAWFPLGWAGWISLQSKGLSRVFSNTTVQKHQFLGPQLALWSKSHIHTWLLVFLILFQESSLKSFRVTNSQELIFQSSSKFWIVYFKVRIAILGL